MLRKSKLDDVSRYEKPWTDSGSSLVADIDQTGFVLFKGLDPDSDDHLLRLGTMLGTIDVGIDEKLLGPTIMHLRYDPAIARENKLPAYFTSNFFPLHTDVSYVPNPPRFMLLHCVNPDPQGDGIYLLADCYAAMASLNDFEQTIIQKRVFSYSYPPNCPEGQIQNYAIFERRMWRYKHSSMCFPNQAKSTLKRFNQALSDVSQQLLLERGDLLIVDNHRIAHGRTAFDPSATSNSPVRHIKRLYATTLKE
jgi:alpha-ketoglutarate-dependent taurine dioxygenase